MNKRSRTFRAVDLLYILMMILPMVCAVIIRVITKPVSSGIEVRGALVFMTIPMPLQPLLITEAQINSALVIVSILGLCLYMTHGITEDNLLRRHHIAEILVEKAKGLVDANMGSFFSGFAPFVAAVLALSGFSSLVSLLGLYPPTSDINITGGWAILVFILITYYKFKCGPIEYMKSFGDPVPFLAPLNIISEVATPVSMTFRHYGNILSGSVIAVLVSAGLQGLSSMLFGFLPGVLGEIPFLQVGIPAILSIYFDVFSGLLQAYIFAMLTMLYIANGFPEELYKKQKSRR